MTPTVELEFDARKAEHRRAADWLANQPDQAEAIVRLIRVADDGEQRLVQLEELSKMLANELRDLRAQLTGRWLDPQTPSEIRENPESARRLDSMFG